MKKKYLYIQRLKKKCTYSVEDLSADSANNLPKNTEDDYFSVVYFQDVCCHSSLEFSVLYFSS